MLIRQQRNDQFIVFEVKEGLFIKRFQKLIDGQSGLCFVIYALINIYRTIKTSLVNGQTLIRGVVISI